VPKFMKDVDDLLSSQLLSTTLSAASMRDWGVSLPSTTMFRWAGSRRCRYGSVRGQAAM